MMNGFYDELIRGLDPVEKAKLEWTTANINRRLNGLTMLDPIGSNRIVQRMINDVYNEIAARRAGKEIEFYRRVINGVIDKVIFNDPATIVLWADGTKTVVKCQPGDVYDKEKGLLLCFVKHALGDTSRSLNDFLHKWVTE